MTVFYENALITKVYGRGEEGVNHVHPSKFKVFRSIKI